MSKDDDTKKTGYGRPPVANQFKPGQSGCPSGGHEQRKQRQKDKAEAAKKKEKEKDKQIVDLVRKIGRQEIQVALGGKVISMARVEATIRKVLDKPLQKDASPRDTATALALYKQAKLLDPAPEKARSSVLVVYPIMEQDEWAKATEGELLPKDPLQGISGAEGFLDRKKPRGTIPDDEAA